jgi:DNA-binding NarL/FixJ family response regulator
MPPQATRGGYRLSSREVEVLEHLVDGLTLKEIAARLHLSPHTVNTHVRNIYAKLEVHSRSGAVARAMQHRLIRRAPAP